MSAAAPMGAPSAPQRTRGLQAVHSIAIAALLLLGGCANGDFGRVRPSLVRDDIHDWVGQKAAREAGQQPSAAHLTDAERELRDLAYPLIEPPYDRGRWDAVLLEYGITRTKEIEWPVYDERAYGTRLLARAYRSASGRYSQLIDDIRNDIDRVGPFFVTARRVLDLDSKRVKSLNYVSNVTPQERADALRRVHENQLIVSWVQHSLQERAAGYRNALERLVIATPFPMAVDAERTLTQLRQQIAANRLVAWRDQRFGSAARFAQATGTVQTLPLVGRDGLHCLSDANRGGSFAHLHLQISS
jgi:hypothetical protein